LRIAALPAGAGRAFIDWGLEINDIASKI